jgi:hypothetical protein
MSVKPTIFVSSTVYGIEELLERIYVLLSNFGYEVWMSHKGTMPVSSEKTAFENCLEAVGKCDTFLGIITPSYGSGIKDGDISITHHEILKAIELNKPRWMLAHENVVFARRLLIDLGLWPLSKDPPILKRGAKSITDLRVIQMYEDAVRHLIPLEERAGNWVQQFSTDEDALLFATAQFSRFQEAEKFIQENLSEPSAIIIRGGE